MKLLVNILYKIYQIIIAFPVLVIWTIFTALEVGLGTTLGNGHYWGYVPGRWWGKVILRAFLIPVTVEGRQNLEKNQSYVFVANHQGAFDIFSIYGFLDHDFKWMMRKGLANIPLVGYACRVAGHIMVDKSSPEALKQTMDTAKERLQGGKSLVVFPEGRRTPDGKMHEFKNGAYRLAVDFKLPVVPITIDGSYKVMPRTTVNITPGKIILTLHEPIIPGDEGHDLSKLVKESRDAILSSLPESEDSEK